MPEISVLRLDQSREMAMRLSEINVGYADILTLKYVYEYTNEEIADMLQLTEVNVRKRLSRARRALKGYTYEDNRVFGDNVMMTFTNGTEEISFDQSPNGASYQFDTEDAQTIEVKVAGSEGYLILKDNRVILYWYDTESGYTIISYDVDPDEIMKMAESMERKQ